MPPTAKIKKCKIQQQIIRSQSEINPKTVNYTSATPIKIILSLLKACKLKAGWKKTKGKLQASERQAKSKLKGS